MKKYILALLVVALGFAACQDEPKKQSEPETKTETKDSLQVLHGEYIYVDSAAVLKGRSFVYGVKLDSMARALGERVDSLKRDQYDMVPVFVKGIVRKNEKEEGWDEIVEIKEILRVMEPQSDPAIRIEGEKSI
jgi:hypothetical protein